MSSRCSICYDNMSTTSDHTITKCGHRFHTSCLFKWIMSNGNKSCPFCRMKLIDEEEQQHIHTEVDVDSIARNLNNEWSIRAYEDVYESDNDGDESDNDGDELEDDTKKEEAEKAYASLIYDGRAMWLPKNKLKRIIDTLSLIMD